MLCDLCGWGKGGEGQGRVIGEGGEGGGGREERLESWGGPSYLASLCYSEK